MVIELLPGVTITEALGEVERLYAMVNMEVHPDKQMLSKTAFEYTKQLYQSDKDYGYISLSKVALGMTSMQYFKD